MNSTVTILVFLILASVALSQKPGDCPPHLTLSQCAKICWNDRYCPGQQKCCRTSCGGTTCVAPVTMRNPQSYQAKRGYCPSQPGGPWVCSSRCSIDGDCRGPKKCCKNRCGAMECMIPSQTPDIE